MACRKEPGRILGQAEIVRRGYTVKLGWRVMWQKEVTLETQDEETELNIV
jgi:hypothetical protein